MRPAAVAGRRTPVAAARHQGGLINHLTIASGFFLDELRARKYTKVTRGTRRSARPLLCGGRRCFSMVHVTPRARVHCRRPAGCWAQHVHTASSAALRHHSLICCLRLHSLTLLCAGHPDGPC